MIVTTDGMPAPGVPLRLLPSAYDPLRDSLSAIVRDTTDNSGAYAFAGVPENLYALEAVDDAMRLLAGGILVFSSTDKIIRPADTLRAPAAALVPLDSSAQPGDYFYVPGSGSYALVTDVDKEKGFAVFADLPADAAIDIQFARASGLSAPLIVAGQVRVSALDTAVISSVPSPWQDVSVGETYARGGALFLGDTLVMAGGGPDIWVWADGFHFVCQPMIGDGSIEARVLYLENTGPWAKAAVMIRETLAPESPHVTLSLESSMNGIDPVPGIAMHDRKVVGGASDVAGSVDSIGAPCWIRLTRTGALFEGFWSLDGTAWQSVGVDSVTIGDTVFAGIAVTSHDAQNLATARLERIRIEY
jgi:hypothetical protein